MASKHSLLTDTHGRSHNYLRISLVEKCNLRCTYCMPQEGVPVTPRAELMNAEEIHQIASLFVRHGVDKIRLTGGEPLLRKDFADILEKLSQLPVSLALTTNGVLIDRFLPALQAAGLRKINLSLDTLHRDRFQTITLRDQFDQVMANLQLLLDHDFDVKLNVVLMRGQNEDEIVDFVELTKTQDLAVRFIEFMPFRGNQWDQSKTISEAYIVEQVRAHFGEEQVLRIADAPNDTARNFQIAGYRGSFASISTVTNPFCDTCNRIRLTANGRLRNCLFSEKEQDLLHALRAGEDLEPIIGRVMRAKLAVRAGLASPEAFDDYANHQKNRSMIRIGG